MSKTKLLSSFLIIALIITLVVTMLPSTVLAKTNLNTRIQNQISGHSGVFSAVVENLKTGEKVTINNHRVRAASIIKLFVMMSAFRKIQEGGLKLNKIIKLQNRTIERVSGTGFLQGQPTGYKISVYKIIERMIKDSDNRAANIMTDLLGFDYINETIKKYGYSADNQLGYYFCLVPVPARKSNTVTASDLNLLLKRIYNKECISPFYDNLMIQIMKKTTNRTKICALLPKDIVVAHKTGSITNHEHDAGIVFSKGEDFAVTVLCEAPNGGSTWSVISHVALEAYNYFNGK